MEALFKKFDVFKSQNDDQKMDYIQQLSDKSKKTIVSSVLDSDESICQDNHSNKSDDVSDLKDTLKPKYIHSFFEDYEEIISTKKKKDITTKQTEDFISGVISQETKLYDGNNDDDELSFQTNTLNNPTTLNSLNTSKNSVNQAQLEELNPEDDYYYENKAMRKVHRNKKKNYGSFIYNNNIHQLKKFNHKNKAPTTNIYAESSSGSEAYDEDYNISEDFFKEKKKILKENKIFYNVLAEYISSNPDMFAKQEYKHQKEKENEHDNEHDDTIHDDTIHDDTIHDDTIHDDTQEHEHDESVHSGSESEEEIETEIVDAIIEHEYQKCLGVLEMLFKYADTKGIVYSRDFLTNKLRGYTIVMKPYCLCYHNYLGYLKIKDEQLTFINGTFLKYCENNNRLLMSKDFKFMFSINPVRLLFKKIRIEDITEWVYDL